MMRFVPILPALALLPIAPAVAQTCLQVDPIDRAGEMVSSPYGVDRSGRRGASAGWHQGLDLVNTARRSGEVKSALAGTVVGKLAPRGGVNLIEVVTGNMKVQYMHMDHIATQAAENPTVSAGQKLGMMGSAGAGDAVHLHLGTLLSGSALQSTTGAGRVWLQQTGSKGASPLTADQIKGAAPQAWYYVNPEPFLTHQVPYQAPATSYNGRTITLPRTCSPAEAIAAPGGDESKQPSGQGRIDPTSEADSGSSQGTIEAHASGRVASEGPSVTLASQARRGVLLEIAKGGATELMAHQLSTQGELDSSLAHLALLSAMKTAAPLPASGDPAP
jgi:murein DD-endopeptidase MepM/ murein hydrolase activator NlpD